MNSTQWVFALFKAFILVWHAICGGLSHQNSILPAKQKIEYKAGSLTEALKKKQGHESIYAELQLFFHWRDEEILKEEDVMNINKIYKESIERIEPLVE